MKLTPAWHTAVSPKGTPHMPAGLLIGIGGKTVYHLGDTALFSDLQLVARRGDKVDVALMCIGGHYTMDRLDAVTAVEFVAPRVVIPCHYDTFPPIETDAQAFKSDAEGQTDAEVVVLQPGQAPSPALANDLKDFVKSRIAPFKYPRWVEFVAELPKTATGKVLKYALREAAWAHRIG